MEMEFVGKGLGNGCIEISIRRAIKPLVSALTFEQILLRQDIPALNNLLQQRL